VSFPKIELHRPVSGQPLLYPQDRSIVAIASHAPLAATRDIPVLDSNNTTAITDFVLRHCGMQNAQAHRKLGTSHGGGFVA